MFAYRLASHLGIASVEDPGGLLDQISASQFQRWLDVYQVQPFGEDRADLRMGIQTAAMLSPFARRQMKPSDFMPRFTPRKRQNVTDMKAEGLRMLAALGVNNG